MSDWKEYKIGEILNVKHGYAFKGENFSEIPTTDILITPGNFKIGGGFKQGKFKYHSGEFPQSYKLKENDIIVTMTDLSKEGDTLGYSAKIPKHTDVNYLHNQRIGLLQFINDNFCRDYIYWVLRTKEYQKFIVNSSTGSTVKHTSPSRICEYKFKAPKLSTQYSISEILSSLDDKIELNNKINQDLESLAQLLFKRWFVDFEFPNENGEPYKSSGGDMIDSELGEIPKGWMVKSFLDISEIKLGGTPSSMKLEYWGGEIPWVNSGEINKNYIISGAKGITELGLKKSATKLIPKFSTLIAITGATLGQVSYSLIDACYNQSVVSITPDLNLSEYVHQYVLSNIDEITSHQTGGAQQHINKGDVEKTKLILPNPQTLNQFSQKISAVYRKIENNLFENEKLTRLRDILLPKLISGELQINDN